MFDIDTFTAVTAGLVLFGGMGLAAFQDDIKAHKEAKQAAKEAERYNQVRIAKPIPAPVKPVQQPTPKPEPKPTEPPRKAKKPTTSPETIEAMHRQADAERAIAEALEHNAQYITDPVKRARIEKQAALAWTQFNKILDRIDKLTATD